MNTDKRFSIFISSTFEDLKEERQAVQDAVLSSGDFPVQMESFPAADQDQFEFIKTLIDKCDYYILIVAGRYGTPADDGMSYTEKEYRYAKSRKIPVLVMLHGNPGSIAASKTESTDEGKERLRKFVEEIQTGRVRNTWTTSGDLKHAVRDALDHVKATRPAVGWVRGDTTASAEILQEINEVRKENAQFRAAIGNLEIELALPPVPEPDTPLEIDLMPRTGSRIGSTYARIRCTWISAFPSFYSNLEWRSYDYNDEYFYSIEVDASCMSIGASLASELATFDTTGLYKITPNAFERLKSYFIETGLMAASGENPFTESGNRAARRHRIADAGQKVFELIEGEISTHTLDDEIPF